MKTFPKTKQQKFKVVSVKTRVETTSICCFEEGSRNLPKKKRNAYFIKVDGVPVRVSEAVYHAYHYYRRKEKTWEEKDERNGVVSYDALDTEQTCGEEAFPDPISMENTVITNVLTEQLHIQMAKLPQEDQELLQALFFECLSEHAYSRKTGIPQRTIHDRKVRVIKRLRDIF